MATTGRTTWSTLTRLAAILLTAGAVFALHATPAGACDFPEPPPPDEALAEADAVFAGQIVTMRPAERDRHVAVTFAVDRIWDGPHDDRLTVITHEDEATCGYPFDREGDEYLVYAYERDGVLQTSLPTRTTPIHQAREDLAALGEGTAAPSAGPVASAARFPRERPVMATIVGLGLIALVVSTIQLARGRDPTG